MKKSKIILPILALIVAGFFIFPIVANTTTNSSHLRLFRKRIKALSHPDHSESVTTHSKIGLLVGNGNHCDFFVGHIRSFDGNKVMIQNHYKNLTFLNPITKNHENCDILFFEDDKTPTSYLPYEFDSLDAWQVKGHDLTKLYVLSIFRSYDANRDFRCR